MSRAGHSNTIGVVHISRLKTLGALLSPFFPKCSGGCAPEAFVVAKQPSAALSVTRRCGALAAFWKVEMFLSRCGADAPGKTSASLPLWARIPRFYIWNNELERAKDAICERPLNLYVYRRGALWLAYHRTQTQSATQWEFVFNPSTDIDSYYSYDTRTRQKCFIRTGYSFQPSIRLNSNCYYVYIPFTTCLHIPLPLDVPAYIIIY